MKDYVFVEVFVQVCWKCFKLKMFCFWNILCEIDISGNAMGYLLHCIFFQYRIEYFLTFHSYTPLPVSSNSEIYSTMSLLSHNFTKLQFDILFLPCMYTYYLIRINIYWSQMAQVFPLIVSSLHWANMLSI